MMIMGHLNGGLYDTLIHNRHHLYDIGNRDLSCIFIDLYTVYLCSCHMLLIYLNGV